MTKSQVDEKLFEEISGKKNQLEKKKMMEGKVW